MDAPSPQREPSTPLLPKFIVIPAGSTTKRCPCGRTMWWVSVDGVSTPVTVATSIETKSGTLNLSGMNAPSASHDGLGFNHYIDCPKRREFKKSKRASLTNGKPTPVDEQAKRDEIAKRIVHAEAISFSHDLRCTGAPDLPESCNGFAVIVFLLDRKLFATPCSVHADAVQRAIKFSGRARDAHVVAIDRYLVEADTEKQAAFCARAAAIRARNARERFSVPKSGPLL